MFTTHYFCVCRTKVYQTFGVNFGRRDVMRISSRFYFDRGLEFYLDLNINYTNISELPLTTLRRGTVNWWQLRCFSAFRTGNLCTANCFIKCHRLTNKINKNGRIICDGCGTKRHISHCTVTFFFCGFYL